MSQLTRFYLGQPGTTATTLFTVGLNTVLLKQILVSNTTAAGATLTLSLVPAGGTASAANRIIPAVSYGANSITLHDLTQVLTIGDFLSALQGTASALTLCISGLTF